MIHTGAPCLIPIFVIPSNRSSALRHTLFQPNRVDDLGSRLAAFIPGGGKRMIFAGMDCVLQAKLNWVEIQRTRDLFHVTVEGPVSLWDAVAAERARGRGVGVYHVCIKADVGRLAIFAIANIQRHGFVPCIACDSQRVTAIRARV